MLTLFWDEKCVIWEHYTPRWTTVTSASYSPDLAPSDFHMFGPLKEAMGGNKFRSDEDIRHAVHEWLRGLPK